MAASTIPDGNTISVRMIDLVNIEGCPTKYLHAPPIDGVDVLPPAPSLSFLLEHKSGRRLLFDLGVPKDLSKLGPEVNNDLKELGWSINVKDDVATFLVENGIDLTSIEAVIWSHSHWDHKGDMTTFPKTTDLIVGPSTIEKFVDGNGNSKIGGVSKADIEGRNLREIDFEMKIGPFKAMDYFADGSFYLLDTPGHEHGHICALARTTNEPSTFVLLGGDVAHHCAEFRPSQYLPMPEVVPRSSQRKSTQPTICPGSWFRDTNISRGLDPNGALYRPLWAADMAHALQSIEKVQSFDGDENILCIIAHDASVRHPDVPFFPATLNEWKSRNLCRYLNWSWVEDVFAVLKKNDKRIS